MKQEDEYYEKWLDQLKTTQPVLDHPDELSAAIMQRISQEPPKRALSSKRRRVLSIGIWVPVAAAGLLLCLMMGEPFFAPVSAPMKSLMESSMEKKELSTWKATSLSLPDNWKKMSRIEKSRYVSSVFRQKELQRMKKERVLENIVKNQTKSTGYEKE